MNRPIIRFGLISAAILIGVNLVTLAILGVPGPEDYAVGEIIGYATILVALIPIFFGIKAYRDRVSGGEIGFWRGVGVGAGIAALPSIAFALYNMIYVTWIDPDFNQTYLAHLRESARAEMSPAEFDQYAAQLEAQQAMFTDPIFQSVLMFLTVFLIGLVIAAISALILQRKQSVPTS